MIPLSPTKILRPQPHVPAVWPFASAEVRTKLVTHKREVHQRDTFQGRHIISRGWLKPEVIDRAFRSPARNAARDLCTLLVHAGLLNAERAMETRRVVAKKLAGVPVEKSAEDFVQRENVLRLYDLSEPLSQSTHRLSYIARHREFGSRVAIRYYRTGALFTEDVLNSLREKSQRVQSLHLPTIAQIYDVFQTKSELVLIRNYVPGHSLKRRIEEGGGLLIKEWLTLFIKISRCLAKVHENGITHGWLTPENIVLNRDEPLITDFGPCESKPSLDVYALGLCMYLALKGVTFHDKLTGRARPAESIPYALEAIVSRCLDSNPARRYRDAGELLFALETYSRAKQAEPLRWWKRGWTWLFRRSGA